MNATIEKFGYPATLVRDYRHWLMLLRPSQPTLGSLVLAAKSEATAFGSLEADFHAELATVTRDIEALLTGFCAFERINYLMLMMVDPHVHFHVVPRYGGDRIWRGTHFVDSGWPAQPRLDMAVALGPEAIDDMVKDLASDFR